MESLSTRVLTSVVGFGIISLIVWIGAYAMLPTLILVSVMGLYEYIRMLDRNEAAPQQTVRDGVTIIPILEEVVVSEKRLVLLAELHLITRTTAKTVTSTVALRKQTAEVTSWPADPFPNPPSTGD